MIQTRAKAGPGWPGLYVRRPYEDTPEGVCWGAARAMLREQFATTLPTVIGLARAYVARRFRAPGRPVAKPEDGDFVVMGDEARPCRHVGVWSSALQSVVAADDAFGSVIAIPLSTMRRLHPRIEFRRVEPDREVAA